MSCLPDTGCTQTIISSETADLLRLKINNNKPVNLFTANGGSVKVLGTSRVHIANKSVSTISTVIVADGMSHPALISWHDMIRLKMLPSQFPAYVYGYISFFSAPATAVCAPATSHQLNQQPLAVDYSDCVGLLG